MTPGDGISGVSNILAIRFARIGDVVLLLPALARLKTAFPASRLTLATGVGCAPVARLCPYLDEVIAVDRLGMRDGPRLDALRDIVRLVRDFRRLRFDLVVDFHSFRETNLLAWLSGATYRLGMKRADRAYLPFCFNLEPVLEDKSLHVADMFEAVVDRLPSLSGTPRFSRPVLEGNSSGTGAAWGREPKDGVRFAFYVGASVAERRWPADRFAELARALVAEYGASVVILAGSSAAEERLAHEVEKEAGAGSQAEVRTGLGIPEMVGKISQADLLVSNDSGPMHIGSALGVPTLGIFSRSLPVHYRPRGARDRYLKGETIEDVQVEEVLAAIREMRTAER